MLQEELQELREHYICDWFMDPENIHYNYLLQILDVFKSKQFLLASIVYSDRNMTVLIAIFDFRLHMYDGGKYLSSATFDSCGQYFGAKFQLWVTS